MKTSTLGILTIGQSPRMDVTPTLRKMVGNHVEILERGALDSLSDQEMDMIAPQDNEITYISKLRNGSSVKISKAKLLPLLQNELTLLEKESDIIVILCTGDFPTLQVTKPIIYPDRLLTNVVAALFSTKKIGLIVPLEEQKESLIEKWKSSHTLIETEVASPYTESDIEGAARRLKNKGAEVLILDCMGYSEDHKTRALSTFEKSVILPRTLVGSIVTEYIN